MDHQYITCVTEQGVATVTLNRPDVLNSCNRPMVRELVDAFERAAADDAVHAVLLTGAGRAFCAGQDLAEAVPPDGSAMPDIGDIVEGYNALVLAIRAIEKPVVCAVNGVAAGAGANIALACDIVIAAKSAKFIESFANIGLIPDSGGTWHLARHVGQARALGMALTGEPISAEKAEAWGLIWKCVDDGALAAEADALVERFAAGPTQGLAATKRAIRGAWMKPLDEELDNERDLMRELGRSADYQEGVAAFMEKRKPAFTGR